MKKALTLFFLITLTINIENPPKTEDKSSSQKTEEKTDKKKTSQKKTEQTPKDEKLGNSDPNQYIDLLTRYIESYGSELTLEECLDLIFATYTGKTLDEMYKLYDRLWKNHEDLNEYEENLLFFKTHVENFFDHVIEKKKIYSRDLVEEIVKDNLILKYLDHILEEEEIKEVEKSESGNEGKVKVEEGKVKVEKDKDSEIDTDL